MAACAPSVRAAGASRTRTPIPRGRGPCARSAAGALVERRGRLLLARRAVPPYKGWWDIPRGRGPCERSVGFLEADEHPEDGARREVREETGLRVRLQGLLGVYLDRYGGSRVLTLYYLARPVGGRERPGDDAAELRWFAPDELPRRVAFPGDVRRVLADWGRGNRSADKRLDKDVVKV